MTYNCPACDFCLWLLSLVGFFAFRIIIGIIIRLKTRTARVGIRGDYYMHRHVSVYPCRVPWQMIRPADPDDDAGDRGADPDRDAWMQIVSCQREKRS